MIVPRVSYLVLMLIPYSAYSENVSKLSDAIQKKLVSVEVSGAGSDTSLHVSSSHYGPCLSMRIANKTNLPLQLQLDYGYKMVPADTAYQTMIVTRTAMFSVSPGQKKSYRLYAMCTEAHDRGPSVDAPFMLGTRAAGYLLSLSDLIQRKNYQNDAAQNAVWCLTNNYDLHAVISEDTTMMYDLRRFVARAKGIPIAQIYEDASDIPGSLLTPIFTTRTVYSGNIEYSIAGMRPVKVMIALFDEDNHMKTVYVNNELQREGIYNYSYRINSEEMNDKKHYVRLFRDGKLEEEVVIVPR